MKYSNHQTKYIGK